ncbi:MAG: CRISPR-associated protein Csx3 [Chloroflexota bacterium]|nr:CRISPR-associated protein Csx3 [Chloroflexota bacterium]
MVNPINCLPAIVIGGPPHAGKSVLFYALTQALRERGIHHHAIRACPDGEGNWSQEGDSETVSLVRTKLKGEWPDAFVKRICLDLEHRCLPFLVDLGGRPQESQTCMLKQCTHSVLLLRADKEEYIRFWQHIVTENNLLPIARIFSQLDGGSMISSESPILEGTISGLERYDRRTAKGMLFDALVERVATLFNSCSPQNVEKLYFEQAPTSFKLNLYESLSTFTSSPWWETKMLRPLLDGLPKQTPLSVYGVGPNWLYAALAAYTGQQPFYQFDPRREFGWISPIRLQFSTTQFSEMPVETYFHQDMTVLSIEIPSQHLDYFQPDPLPFPPVPTDKGLVISGRIPHWLLTALVRLYRDAGVPWIAPYYVQENKAIVAYSSVEIHQLGDRILAPIPSPKS